MIGIQPAQHIVIGTALQLATGVKQCLPANSLGSWQLGHSVGQAACGRHPKHTTIHASTDTKATASALHFYTVTPMEGKPNHVEQKPQHLQLPSSTQAGLQHTRQHTSQATSWDLPAQVAATYCILDHDGAELMQRPVQAFNATQAQASSVPRLYLHSEHNTPYVRNTTQRVPEPPDHPNSCH
jgi:hypothetical protein